jgi:tetratricopeptide (TPR) repeat protein
MFPEQFACVSLAARLQQERSWPPLPRRNLGGQLRHDWTPHLAPCLLLAQIEPVIIDVCKADAHGIAAALDDVDEFAAILRAVRHVVGRGTDEAEARRQAEEERSAKEALWQAEIVEHLNEKFDENRRKGVERLKAVIANWSEALRRDPKKAIGYVTRGRAYYYIEDYDHAIADFTEALRLEPAAMTYCLRGDAYARKRDCDHAIADITEAIRRKDSAHFYERRAFAKRVKGDYDGAKAPTMPKRIGCVQRND